MVNEQERLLSDNEVNTVLQSRLQKVLEILFKYDINFGTSVRSSVIVTTLSFEISGLRASLFLFSSFFTQEAKRLLSRTSPPDIDDFIALDTADTRAMVVYSALTLTSKDLVECHIGSAT
jgi:hypothetical protein